MERKKLKITIECEGKDTQVMEANGIAAAMLTDGEDSDHYGLRCLIVGHMKVKDLIQLHEGVGDELISSLEKNIISNLSPKDLLSALLEMRGAEDESEG